MNDQVGFCVGGGGEYGWPTSEPGVVLRTTDGGDTWSTVYSQADVAFVEVVAYNDTVVCAGRAMDHSVRLRSYDAGVTWMTDTMPYVMDMLTVEDGVLRYTDTSTGLHEVRNGTDQTYDLGYPMAYHVQNGSYTQLVEDTIVGLSVVQSDDPDAGWTLHAITLPTAVYAGWPSAVYRHGDTLVVRNTDRASTLISIDQGSTWTPVYTGPYSHTEFRSASNIYGLADRTIQHSTDIGTTWETQYTSGSRLLGIYFFNDQLGFACGNDGTILKTGNGGFTTGVAEMGTMDVLQVHVYPNPAQDELILGIPAELQVSTIDLISMDGSLIRTFPSVSRALPIQGIAPGSYVLRVGTQKGMRATSVVIH
jgi:photosystem II stability/assembly factor-like uncharacterized protein